MTYFIDTNIFLRALIKEDKTSFHACAQLLALVRQGRLKATTCSLILAEIVWTLSSYYRFSKLVVIRAVRSIINLNNLKIINNYNHGVAIDFYMDKNVKYIDCMIASINKIIEKKLTIITYDKDFKKLPVISKTPEEIIR